MPNKRAPNKVSLGGFVDRSFVELLSQAAEKEGAKNRLEFLLQLAREGLRRRGIEVPEPPPPPSPQLMLQRKRESQAKASAQYRRKMRKAGLCWICREKAVNGSWFCLRHLVAKREAQRKKSGATRRRLSAGSYQAEAQGHQ